MEKLKSRKDINQEDCWDLTKIIKDDQEFQKLITIVKKNNHKICQMKGHILDNAQNLLKYLQTAEKENRALEKLILYSKLAYDEDTNNNASKNRYLNIENLYNEVSEKESFITSELMSIDYKDMQNLLKKDNQLKPYTLYFKRLYKDKKRVLSEQQEAIIAQAYSAFGTPDEAFNSLDVTDAIFDDITINNTKEPLTHYNYIHFLENPNQKIREQAFKAYHRFYEQHKNTFASLLKGNYQELEFTRSIRKYKTALDMALDNINVSKDVYDNLINNVHKYMSLNVTYQKLKAQALNNPEYHLYDTYVPIVSLDKKYTKDEAIKIVNQALQPLGEDYLLHLQKMFANHTIDYYPSIGKENGAYQWGCYDSPSYVLLNFNGSSDSVSTMAHELGHAIHSMYSNEFNNYIYHEYEIFLAEIASTVNETLLSFYFLENAQSKKEKIYYLCEFLDRVKATIYRQTMFAEFEKIMSEKCQNKESLTEQNFSDTYYHLNQEYFQDSVIVDECIKYEYMRISHFYRPFYVYKYATGLISALCIVSNLLNKKDYQNKYLTFLKSGSSKNVLDILKSVDVDLTTNEPYEKAFSLINAKLTELKQLLEAGDYNE